MEELSATPPSLEQQSYEPVCSKKKGVCEKFMTLISVLPIERGVIKRALQGRWNSNQQHFNGAFSLADHMYLTAST